MEPVQVEQDAHYFRIMLSNNRLGKKLRMNRNNLKFEGRRSINECPTTKQPWDCSTYSNDKSQRRPFSYPRHQSCKRLNWVSVGGNKTAFNNMASGITNATEASTSVK